MHFVSVPEVSSHKIQTPETTDIDFESFQFFLEPCVEALVSENISDRIGTEAGEIYYGFEIGSVVICQSASQYGVIFEHRIAQVGCRIH